MHRTYVLFLFVLILCCVAAGCGGSTSSTLPSGSTVEVVSDTATLRQKSSDDTAAVEFEGATIDGSVANEADNHDSEMHGLNFGGIQPYIIVQPEEEQETVLTDWQKP